MEQLKEIDNKEQPYNVWFCADSHILHGNILYHQPQRIEAMGLKDKDDIQGHCEKFLEIWFSKVKRGDHVYLLGDVIFDNKENSIKILHMLKSKGAKLHLITGNHDKSIEKLDNMFESIDLIKVVDFKSSIFTFIEEETFPCVMCHYPLVSWPRKAHGAAQLHGHTHDNSPWENEGDDLRLNLGFDTSFANFDLVNLKQVYAWYKEKLGGLTPKEYIEKVTRENPKFIR